MKRFLVITTLLIGASLPALAQSANPPASDSRQPEQTQGGQPAWTNPDPLPRQNFDPEARLSPAGRSVTVSGRIGVCEPGERTADIQVSLLQPSTLASINAKTTLPCPAGGTVRFVIPATVPNDKPAFEEGPVQACALAISRSGRSILGLNIVDVAYWCTFVRLVKE